MAAQLTISRVIVHLVSTHFRTFTLHAHYYIRATTTQITQTNNIIFTIDASTIPFWKFDSEQILNKPKQILYNGALYRCSLGKLGLGCVVVNFTSFVKNKNKRESNSTPKRFIAGLRNACICLVVQPHFLVTWPRVHKAFQVHDQNQAQVSK